MQGGRERTRGSEALGQSRTGARAAGGREAVPAAPTESGAAARGGASYATASALRRAFEQRVGPVPVGAWRRLCLPASWAPFTDVELEELIAWWRSASPGSVPTAHHGRPELRDLRR